MSLDTLAAERSVVVCCGSGGVGKTTTAAAIAVEAAERGRKACVVTIDPAKRLADALGLAELTNAPARVEGVGHEGGELWALMLDTSSTFDETVRRYAGTPAQAEAILTNRIYRNIANTLSGTQEYMAMEKLYELHSGGSGVDFDLVVIDTPPTRNALDFLDAPRRLTRFLDHRLFRLIAMPTRMYLKAVSVAAQAFVRTVTRVVGGEVIADVLAFFNAFEGMEEGFRQRAKAVYDLLADPATAFVLVASPRRDSVDEALYFARKLAESDITVAAVVVNRVFPRFGRSGAAAGAGRRREFEGGSALAVLEANLADLDAVATREAETVEELAKAVDGAALQCVPLLPGDVHDVEGLRELSGFLFGRVA